MTKYILNFSLLTLSIIICLLLIEFGITFFYPVPFNNHKEMMMFDDALGWKIIPDKKSRYEVHGKNIIQEINSKSIRGGDYGYDLGEKERILILADSFSHAVAMNDHEIFSAILQKKLQKSSTNIEVINSGVSGYSTDQEYIYYLTEGYKYQAQNVILMFFFNDVIFNNRSKYWMGSKPLLDIVGDGVIYNGKKLIKENSRQNGDQSWKIRFINYLHNNSNLAQFLFSRLKKINFINDIAFRLGFTRYRKSTNKIKMNNVKVPLEFRAYKLDDSEYELAWSMTEKIIKSLNDLISQNGKKLTVFYIPSKYEVDDKQWERFLKSYNIDNTIYSKQKVVNSLEKICSKHKIDFINPIQTFRKETREKDLYFSYDSHWNESGHQLVGRILSEHFQKVLSQQ